MYSVFTTRSQNLCSPDLVIKNRIGGRRMRGQLHKDTSDTLSKVKRLTVLITTEVKKQ